ncbi:MAG: hypothetical protein IE934_17760, partial [Sphingopyxis sp.]|nr:hypothetical protein [Sphingopyxis sp.]
MNRPLVHAPAGPLRGVDLLDEGAVLAEQDVHVLADFSADRRDLRLRWNESATVIALSAPAPNLTFVGEDMNILFREDRAFVEQVN